MRTGEDLRALRMGLGMTQAQMAQAIGVERNYIYMVESGRKPMSKKLDNALDEYLAASSRGSIQASNNGGGVVIGSPGAVVGVGGGEGCDWAGRVRDLEERVSALERLVVKLVSERDVP